MKILIVRFSSIGDIVLTSPIIRAISEQIDNVEIHFLTKVAHRSLVENNPRVEKVYTINQSIGEVIEELKSEKYDWFIDLHNNIRTKSLKQKLKVPYSAFRKLNVAKWLLVNLKMRRLPDIHVVERYFEAVAHLGVVNDNKRGEFGIPQEYEVDVKEVIGVDPGEYITVAIGAKFKTKQLPVSKIISAIDGVHWPVVLVGGNEDKSKGEEVAQLSRNRVINTCGKLNLHQSGSVVRQSRSLLTNDTGMMHIAACFDVPIISVWGNTVPEFGMYPYRPEEKQSFTIHEVEGLNCRPCSKIGFQKCPKGHFKCMMNQDTEKIRKALTNN